jgi:hypothetical protein
LKPRELAGLKSERSQILTDTINDVAAEAAGEQPVEPAFDEQSLAERLVAQAREKASSWLARTVC